jgi:hypothetical protein
VGASLQASASITVTVQVLPDSDFDALATDITALGGTVLGQAANSIAGYLDALVPQSSIADIARLDGVVWINHDLPVTLQNDVGGGAIMRVDDVRQNLGLFGAGQIVAVVALIGALLLAPCEGVPRAWRSFVFRKRREVDRKAYTLCTLEQLQVALRRRAGQTAPGSRLGDPTRQCLPYAQPPTHPGCCPRTPAHPA